MAEYSVREQRGWYMYDFANSAFYTTVITLFLGPYLTALATNGADAAGYVHPFGIPVYAKQGAAAFRKWLETEGVKNINNVNDRLKAATSWHPMYEVEPALVGA